MNDQSIYDKIKYAIGVISFTIYLWSIGRTRKQYWEEIYSEMKIVKGETIFPLLRVTKHINLKDYLNEN